ncbi:MAG: hypothetical protein ACXITV_12620 [Luteibaculaceae bacterium]
MKKLFRPLILVGLFLCVSNVAFSQFSVSYYSSSLSKIGIAYDFSPRLWTEFRTYTNTDIEYFTPELVVNFNAIRKDKHNIYFGLGAAANNEFFGFVAPIGVQFFPIESFDRFSLHIEFKPIYDIDFDEMLLTGAWGIRYRFGNRK